jgi:oxygen-independent coproporphyrinogen-3 oxidase
MDFSLSTYADWVGREINMAVAQSSRLPTVNTVYFGGGTPTLLPVADLAFILNKLRQVFPFQPDCEISTEANPDSLCQEDVDNLAQAGFTRLSLGMQSAVPAVLKRLNRTHQPERVEQVLSWAAQAGLATSVDLIYGTPGETLDDWQYSVEQALSYQVKHISAYALTLSGKTSMAYAIRKKLMPPIDEDDLVDKYYLADSLFRQAGLPWYEISNWAADGAQCQHNLIYWRSGQWWGFGPGAHSAMANRRWHNKRHPMAWASDLRCGNLPLSGEIVVPPRSLAFEFLMSGIRLAEGIDLAYLAKHAPVGPDDLAIYRQRVSVLVDDGLLVTEPSSPDRVRLSDRGRMLADTVVRNLSL